MGTTNKYNSFRIEIETLINRMSMENHSNTHDFILASYLCECLKNFDNHVQWRDKMKGGKEQAQEAVSDGVED